MLIGDTSKIELEFGCVGFLRRGQNWSTQRKTSHSKDENQQQTQPTCDGEVRNVRTRATLVGGERSHHRAIPACPENKISPPRFTDLVTTMSVVSRACSFNSRTDVLLEILKEMYCLFYLPIKTAETRSSQFAVYFLYSKCKEKPYPWKETRIVVLNLSQPYSAWTFFELLSLGGGGGTKL